MGRSHLRTSISGPGSKPLTRDDEARLAAEITAALEAGDTARHRRARNELVERHLRLVVMIGRSYEHKLDREEIMAVGALALTEAMERWRPGEGSMSAYQWARRWIFTALTKAADSNRTIRIPTPVAYRAACNTRAVGQREAELGRRLTASEIEEVTGGGPILEDLPLAYAATLGPATIEGTDDINNVDPTDRLPTPEESYMKTEAIARLNRAFADLEPDERDVLVARFGLDGQQPLTLVELGARRGISGEAIRRLEASALAKLAHPANPEQIGGLSWTS